MMLPKPSRPVGLVVLYLAFVVLLIASAVGTPYLPIVIGLVVATILAALVWAALAVGSQYDLDGEQ